PAEAGAGGIFSILSKTFGPAALVAVPDICATLGSRPNTAEPTAASEEDASLSMLALELTRLEGRIVALQDDYRNVAKKISAFANCNDIASPPTSYCKDQSSYDPYRQEILASLRTTLLGPMPATAISDMLAQKAQDSQKTISAQDWASYEG